MIQKKPGKAYAEKLPASYGGERSLDNMRRLIRDTAEHFHTTEMTARTRLLDLGYNEVRGLLRAANGKLVPSYLCRRQETAKEEPEKLSDEKAGRQHREEELLPEGYPRRYR